MYTLNQPPKDKKTPNNKELANELWEYRAVRIVAYTGITIGIIYAIGKICRVLAGSVTETKMLIASFKK